MLSGPVPCLLRDRRIQTSRALATSAPSVGNADGCKDARDSRTAALCLGWHTRVAARCKLSSELAVDAFVAIKMLQHVSCSRRRLHVLQVGLVHSALAPSPARAASTSARDQVSQGMKLFRSGDVQASVQSFDRCATPRLRRTAAKQFDAIDANSLAACSECSAASSVTLAHSAQSVHRTTGLPGGKC